MRAVEEWCEHYSAVIELRDASVAFVSAVEQVRALDAVSLRVLPGELVVLFGASGSGKSTLLNVVGGLQRVDSGEVQVLTHHVSDASDAESAAMRLADVGVVFQNDNLIPEFTAAENVELPLRARGRTPLSARAEAWGMLEQVGLDGLQDRIPAQLSGGQRQRVGIARALVGGRRVLLADEPTGALDSENSTAIFGLLRSLADTGVAVVIASHDPGAQGFADRVATMRDGQLVALQTVEGR